MFRLRIVAFFLKLVPKSTEFLPNLDCTASMAFCISRSLLFFFGCGKKAHLTAFRFDDFGKTQHNASYWAFGIDMAVEELRRGAEQEVE